MPLTQKITAAQSLLDLEKLVLNKEVAFCCCGIPYRLSHLYLHAFDHHQSRFAWPLQPLASCDQNVTQTYPTKKAGICSAAGIFDFFDTGAKLPGTWCAPID